jgi:hypothetical protein
MATTLIKRVPERRIRVITLQERRRSHLSWWRCRDNVILKSVGDPVSSAIRFVEFQKSDSDTTTRFQSKWRPYRKEDAP